jgi:hypothetical protein
MFSRRSIYENISLPGKVKQEFNATPSAFSRRLIAFNSSERLDIERKQIGDPSRGDVNWGWDGNPVQ